MGRWIVIAGLLVATAGSAGAQTLGQYQSRPTLQDSSRGVTNTLPSSRSDTSATINNRIERQQVQRQNQADSFGSRVQQPGLIRPLR